MSYFEDHGIEEPKVQSSFRNSDVNEFMTEERIPITEAIGFFQNLQVNHNPVLDGILQQLTQDESRSPTNPPASKDFVNSLKTVQINDENCSICLGVLRDGFKLPCTHYYHETCIRPWFALHNTCPSCRKEYVTDDAEYEKRKRLDLERKIKEEDSEEEWDPFYS